MNERQIDVTVIDLDRAGCLVLTGIIDAPEIDPPRALVPEFDRAQAVRPEEVSPDVITMNTKLRMTDLQSDKQRIVTLIYPEQANDDTRVSILSALGTALLWYRLGDEIRWGTPTRQLALAGEPGG